MSLDLRLELTSGTHAQAHTRAALLIEPGWGGVLGYRGVGGAYYFLLFPMFSYRGGEGEDLRLLFPLGPLTQEVRLTCQRQHRVSTPA